MKLHSSIMCRKTIKHAYMYTSIHAPKTDGAQTDTR